MQNNDNVEAKWRRNIIRTKSLCFKQVFQVEFIDLKVAGTYLKGEQIRTISCTMSGNKEGQNGSLTVTGRRF